MQTVTKNYIAWSIRIVVSILFIISAIAKLYPSPYFAISTFEVKQLYPLGFSGELAPYFSRTLIGIELALGILILQKNYLRNFIIPITILLLAVFVGHLTYVTFLSGGNTGNCGCFGELIPMTPIEAIAKNVVAILLLVYLFFIFPKTDYKLDNFWILTTTLFASILGLYMLAPMQPTSSNFSIAPTESQETIIDSTSISNNPIETISDETIIKAPIKDTIKKDVKIIETEPKKTKSGYSSFFPSIDKGKKILGFFVPGCEHCRIAAKELTEMRKKDASLPPLSIIFMNEEADLIPAFFKEAGAEYPYKIIEIIPFWTILGSGKDTPGVKYLWNGNDIKYYWGTTDSKFDGADLENQLKKSFLE